MRRRKGVDSILLENIAESEKSITDEVIELSPLFSHSTTASDFFLCFRQQHTVYWSVLLYE